MLLAGSGASGQEPPSTRAEATPDEPFVFHAEASVQLVLVPVSVTRKGKHVSELTAESFRLSVDGITVPIEVFEPDARTPVSFVLLQDLSGSIANDHRFERSRRAASFFVDRASGDDELAIATFAGGRTMVDVPFTKDRGAVREAIELWEPWGTTALHDAVAWLPEIGLDGRHNRRAAILVTDGADNASQLDPASARDLVRRARLPVYVLDLGGHRSVAPGPEGEQIRRFGHLLRELAAATDGGYHPIDDDDDLIRACAAIERDLANQYVLGFDVGTRGWETEHRLEVVVTSDSKRAERLEIEHRPAYFGRRPAAMTRSVELSRR